ncbi:stage II sporulation protein P [Paenibacillus sp. FSL A5-0031]|uniref:stage II sporulation protein P n=1 Tax=Paenibacillus sp. FSL A5-0031 TaxID=1920420 RepID=UPI00096C485D|nr:stage II sporulation protein P [Paenibacillus sp. FSL A5-0031]OME86776.1 stage II sporulation protein P [Paenibacillus sp. FSL A5-0031]
MKRKIMLLDIGKESRRVRQLLVTGRTFALLSFCSMVFFILLGAAGMAHQQTTASPVNSMKGFAAAVSSGFFGDMLEMEMPAFQSSRETDTFTSKQISAFLMRALTDINPNDPKSLLAGELPGMGVNDAYLIRKGIGTDTAVGPEDNAPITYDPLGELHEDTGTDVSNNVTTEENEEEPLPVQTDKPSTGNGEGDNGETAKPTTGGKKVAFIYHSHNRESWYPELTDKKKDPNSSTKNITLVGKRLAQKLEEKGVGAQHSNTDYPTAIKGYDWNYSYKYSMKTVKEAIASSKDLKFFFDLHRDSQRRKETTIDIDGKSYAQVYFIIGHKNPNWEKNEAFATKIHEALEKKYPGISRGIWGKTASSGNAEYNQSLAEDNVLIEVGGVDNTLEESYRTADALAAVISEIYWADEKASTKK